MNPVNEKIRKAERSSAFLSPDCLHKEQPSGVSWLLLALVFLECRLGLPEKPVAGDSRIPNVSNGRLFFINA